MVNVQSMRMVWAVAMVMVVVVSVNVQQVAAKKAKKDPASYGLPPAASSDCDGVAVGMGGATKVADPNDCTKYSLCLTSFGFKLDCPEGKHFSAVEGFCTSPEKAGCDPAFATAAPTAPAAEDATEEAAGEAAETKLQTEANLETAEQAEEAADEVPEVAGEAGQAVEDVQSSADEVVAEV
uniref:Putative mucin peritrophin salivary protein n=1 Tax=Amblyomma triste TaxID=251400 RepID=A0A023GDG0_AMBTT